MLDYLVTSRTRRKLLRTLWLDDSNGTAQELAQNSGLAFAGAYRELKAMATSGLAIVNWRNGKKTYSANKEHPLANVLMKLLESKSPQPSHEVDEHIMLRENLAFLGLPVNSRKTPPDKNVKLESLLARAFELAAEDASVARALPVLLHKVKHELDYKDLKFESRKLGNKHRAGFFLELTGILDEDQGLVKTAKTFFDRRYKDHNLFFKNQSKYSVQLARERTPMLAKKWGWLMNMEFAAFDSTYRKFNNEQIR